MNFGHIYTYSEEYDVVCILAILVVGGVYFSTN